VVLRRYCRDGICRMRSAHACRSVRRRAEVRQHS